MAERGGMAAALVCGVSVVLSACAGRGPTACPLAYECRDEVTNADTSPAARAGVADLDTQFEEALSQWQEESRWAEFLAGIFQSGNTRAQDDEKLRRLDQHDFMLITESIGRFSSRCTLVWYVLAEAELRGRSQDDPVTKRAFVDKWQEVGQALHTTRVQLVILVTEKIWGTDAASLLKKLETEFPDKGLRTVGAPRK